MASRQWTNAAVEMSLALIGSQDLWIFWAAKAEQGLLIALGLCELLLASSTYLQLDNHNIGNIAAISYGEYRKVRRNTANAKLALLCFLIRWTWHSFYLEISLQVEVGWFLSAHSSWGDYSIALAAVPMVRLPPPLPFASPMARMLKWPCSRYGGSWVPTLGVQLGCCFNCPTRWWLLVVVLWLVLLCSLSIYSLNLAENIHLFSLIVPSQQRTQTYGMIGPIMSCSLKAKCVVSAARYF